MEPFTSPATHRAARTAGLPGHIHHESFTTEQAQRDFDPVEQIDALETYDEDAKDAAEALARKLGRQMSLWL